MRIKNQKDFLAGLLYAAAGMAFAFRASSQPIGNGDHVAHGYFPLVLGVALTLIGAVVTLQSLALETPDGNPAGQWAFRPLICISAANFAFGALLGGIPGLGVPAMGLALAAFGLVMLSAMAGPALRWGEALILALILAAGSWAALAWALNLRLQVWPAFFNAG
ncbi:MAG: tripartite tricarboxylate transporter TctB family protein [Desulfovibrionaceae bacterium]|nr:tripartite tricarboxylate transporter TctB family protein [Desulfovibrionaceae bacterium]